MTVKQRLKDRGLTLRELPERLANYLWFKQAGDLAWISGQGPRKADGSFAGEVGRDFSPEEAYGHAKLVGLDLLAVAREAARSLDKADVVKLVGLVNP